MSNESITNVSRVVRRLLDERQMSQEDVASMSNLDKSAISRLLNIDIRNTPEKIDSLLLAFPDPLDQYSIVVAHFQDECSARARETVIIRPRSGRVKVEALPTGHLSVLAQQALAFLLRQSSIEMLILDLARVIGWEANTNTKPTPTPAGGGGGRAGISARRGNRS